MANEPPNKIEIAKYPIRCHNCGKTDMVRIFVYKHELDGALFNGFSPCMYDMLTHRLAPRGWRWTVDIDNNYMPVWLCPDCAPDKRVL